MLQLDSSETFSHSYPPAPGKLFLLWFSRCVRLFATSWTAACQAPLSSAVSWSLLRFMSIESMMLSNHLTLYLPFLLLPSLFCSIRVFSRESALRPKYWSFSSSPSSEYSGFPLGLTALIVQSKELS